MMVSEALTKWKSLDRSIIAELRRPKDGRRAEPKQKYRKQPHAKEELTLIEV
jgi:hypothetical protein